MRRSISFNSDHIAAYSFFSRGTRTVTSVGLFVRAAKFNIVMSSQYLPCFQWPVLLLLLQSFSLESPRAVNSRAEELVGGGLALGLALGRSTAFPSQEAPEL